MALLFFCINWPSWICYFGRTGSRVYQPVVWQVTSAFQFALILRDNVHIPIDLSRTGEFVLEALTNSLFPRMFGPLKYLSTDCLEGGQHSLKNPTQKL